jgi:hypothetical protein
MIAMATGFVVGLAILGGIVVCVGFLWLALRRPVEDERHAADASRIIARLRGSTGRRGRLRSTKSHRYRTLNGTRKRPCLSALLREGLNFQHEMP